MTLPGQARRGVLGYVEIGDMLRARLARGELKPGDRVSPVRDQAAELGVNVNTVARAYAELAREGVLVAHAGAGTRVASEPEGELFRRAREARLGELVGSTVLQALGMGYRPEQIEAAVVRQLARWTAGPPAEDLRTPAVEQVVVFAGSHDLALDLLAARLHGREPPIVLRAGYRGSLEGLMALARGEAHIAGCHLLDEQTGDYNAPFVARLLPGQPVVLVTLALREQGLMARSGNPKGIRGLADLTRPDVTLALRQRGSGTRVLLDQALRRRGLSPDALAHSTHVYDTHVAAAGAVADGSADVALGIRGAARAFGLEFIPVATERYELAIPERLLEESSIRAVVETLTSGDFRGTVHELGGYDVLETGHRRAVP